jgi:hypothetical protein
MLADFFAAFKPLRTGAGATLPFGPTENGLKIIRPCAIYGFAALLLLRFAGLGVGRFCLNHNSVVLEFQQ